MRDPDTGASKGYGFVSYDSFEASDAAVEAMNGIKDSFSLFSHFSGQYLCGRPISVSYAFKKDSKERHGTHAERLLAANNPALAASRPNMMIAAAMSGTPMMPQQMMMSMPQMTAPSMAMAPQMPMQQAPPGMSNPMDSADSYCRHARYATNATQHARNAYAPHAWSTTWNDAWYAWYAHGTTYDVWCTRNATTSTTTTIINKSCKLMDSNIWPLWFLSRKP